MNAPRCRTMPVNWMNGSIHAALIFVLLSNAGVGRSRAAEPIAIPDGYASARSFVDQAQIVSKYATELYAHQSSLRIVKGIGYAAYQCNETTVEENKAGQIVRLAIFNILNPAASAKWVDIATPGESSNEITLTGNFVASPILHTIGDETLRVFFSIRQAEEGAAAYRVFFKDFSITEGKVGELRSVRCTIEKNHGETFDLSLQTVQRHLDFLFEPGLGAKFGNGLSPTCDMVNIDGQLYSTIQAKNSSEGKTLLMTNVLMGSYDNGANWHLFGAPDPRRLPGDDAAVKILAEPALSYDAENIYLHLRSNVRENGYVLAKAPRSNPYLFDAPVKKWTYGIGRPAICDFGKPIGLVALFTASSVPLGGKSLSRNRCDVVRIDSSYSRYTLAFPIVDSDAVNTPFISSYNDEMYVVYSTGRRRLSPPYGVSEILFTRLRREFFVAPSIEQK